jgi:hypothetical protein
MSPFRLNFSFLEWMLYSSPQKMGAISEVFLPQFGYSGFVDPMPLALGLVVYVTGNGYPMDSSIYC